MDDGEIISMPRLRYEISEVPGETIGFEFWVYLPELSRNDGAF
jgi:hypothetical protein